MSSQSSVNENEIEKIINEVKSQGVFDDIRRDCISDVDTKVSQIRLTFPFSFIEYFKNIVLQIKFLIIRKVGFYRIWV